MKKLRNLTLSSIATLGIGAGLILGNATISAQIMASDIEQDTYVINMEENFDNDNAKTAIRYVYENEDDSNLDGNYTVTVTRALSEGNVVDINLGDIEIAEFAVPAKTVEISKQNPTEKDIPENKAIQIAKNELTQKYALKQELIDKFNIESDFYLMKFDLDEEISVWNIDFYPKNPDNYSELGHFNVKINSETGDIFNISSAADDDAKLITIKYDENENEDVYISITGVAEPMESMPTLVEIEK